MAYTGFYNVTAVTPIQSLTDSGVSGTEVKSGIRLTVDPPSDSVKTVFANSSELTYTSSSNLLAGAWLSGTQSVVNVTGTGDVGKIAGNMSVVNNVGTGSHVEYALGYEAVVTFMQPSSTIDTYAAYYIPNMTAVPNIGNVAKFGGFVNHYSESFNQSFAPSYNANMQEIVPPYHPGLIPGRYYSRPHRFVVDDTSVVGLTYCIPIYIPHRQVISTVGFRKNSNVASSNARVAIYNSLKGTIANRVWQSGEISTSAGGGQDHEVSVGVRLEAGTYWLLFSTSHALPMKYHAGDSLNDCTRLYGSESSTQADVNIDKIAYITRAHGAYPDAIDAYPTFAQAQGEPHVWFRV